MGDNQEVLKESIDISVIVSVYNTLKSAFIDCMDSIICQDFKNFEVIVIDDGSDKLCANYIDEYVKKYRNIRIYHQNNRGVSAARNFGMNVAKGSYIMFVDADDIIFPQVLKRAFWLAKEYHADIIAGGVKVVKEEERKKIKEQLNKKKLRNKIEEGDIKLLKRHMIDLSIKKYKNFDGGAYISRGCCSKLIKTEIAKTILFDKRLPIGEDDIWNLVLLLKNPKIILDFQSWYCYIKNELSATSCYRKNIIHEVQLELSILFSYVDKKNMKEKKSYYNRVLEETNRIFYNYLWHPLCPMSIREKIKILRITFHKRPWKDLSKKEISSMFSVEIRRWIFLCRTGWIVPYWSVKQWIIGKKHNK